MSANFRRIVTSANGEAVQEGHLVLVQLEDGTYQFAENENVDPNIPEECPETSSEINKSFSQDNIKLWSHEAILLLISLVNNHNAELEKSIKKYIWQKIAQEISDAMNMTYTWVQVDTKWKGLVKTYKDIINHNNSTGKCRKQWKYFEKINDILFKKPEINPVATCSSNAGLLIQLHSGMVASTSATSRNNSDDSEQSSTYESTFSKKRRQKESGIEKRHADKMQRLDRLQGTLDRMVDLLATRNDGDKPKEAEK